MARKPRIKVPGHAAAYHVVTRTNGQEFRLDDYMKKTFVKKLRRLNSLYYTKISAFSIIDSHYHILVNFKDPEDVDPEEAMERWNSYHGKEYRLNGSVEAYREYVVNELTNVSSFMKRLNLFLTKEYNRHTGKVGTVWQGRFNSTIFERGFAVLTCAAYIELNSFRASLVNKPEDYKYSSLHYLRNGNKDGLVDIDLLEEGLGIRTLHKELTDLEAFTRELYSTYLAFVYEAGTRAHRAKHGVPKKGGIVITAEMQEQLKKYGIEGEKGSYLRRAWEYTKGRFVGGSDFAQRFYEEHISRGYTGSARENHIEKWVHSLGKGLWSVFNIMHKGWSLRGSP